MKQCIAHTGSHDHNSDGALMEIAILFSALIVSIIHGILTARRVRRIAEARSKTCPDNQ